MTRVFSLIRLDYLPSTQISSDTGGIPHIFPSRCSTTDLLAAWSGHMILASALADNLLFFFFFFILSQSSSVTVVALESKPLLEINRTWGLLITWHFNCHWASGTIMSAFTAVMWHTLLCINNIMKSCVALAYGMYCKTTDTFKCLLWLTVFCPPLGVIDLLSPPTVPFYLFIDFFFFFSSNIRKACCRHNLPNPLPSRPELETNLSLF